MTVLLDDCRAVLAGMEPNSVDAIVTDPPYGLNFMGKGWDNPTMLGQTATVPGHGLSGGWKNGNGTNSRGLADNDPVKFQAWSEEWAREALRVLKPGGHLLAFGGPRTFHRLAVALEDAGFEIRDTLSWLYGSGFPKSLDVAKAIDKAAGAQREVVGQGRGRTGPAAQPNGGSVHSDDNYQWPGDYDITAPATDLARQWEGWGTALKPAHEPIILARKPLAGTVAQNVEKFGVGALNINGCRLPHGPDDPNRRDNPSHDRSADGATWNLHKTQRNPTLQQGRWPANVCLDAEAAALLGPPARFFYCAKAGKAEREAGLDDLPAVHRPNGNKWTDQDYRVARGERPPSAESGPRRNVHPTVKPVALMRWLVKLVTPPEGLVLDPFAGSGSTGVACALEGFRFLGIEQDAEYAEIARRRIAHATPPLTRAAD